MTDELIIHPKHPTADDTYFIGGAWAPACITAKDKRFSDAELAAEYWHATYDGGYHWTRGEPERLVLERHVFRRFAELPHFDQERA